MSRPRRHVATARLLGARWPATYPPQVQRLPTMKPGESLATTVCS